MRHDENDVPRAPQMLSAPVARNSADARRALAKRAVKGAIVRIFAHLGEENALVSGSALPAPQPVFPRYVEPKTEGEGA